MARAILIVTILLAGIFQYLQFILGGVSDIENSMWNIDVEDAQAGSGISVYIKDGFVVAFGLFWPTWILFQKNYNLLSLWFRFYIIWIMSFFIYLAANHFINENHELFLLSGSRWLLLLHCSIGVSVFFRLFSLNKDSSKYVFWIIVLLSGSNVYMSTAQLVAGSFLNGVGVGAARTTGLFTNAAISGFLGLAVVFMTVFDRSFNATQRLCVLFIGLATAILSGTRFLMISQFILLIGLIYDILIIRLGRNSANKIAISSIGPLIFITVVLYTGLINLVDRGGIFSEALDDDGRFGRLVFGFSRLFDEGYLATLFGAGIGMGTNTSFTLALLSGVSQDKYPLNILVDNGFLTLILQSGFIGLLWFIAGLLFIFNKLSFNCEINKTNIAIVLVIFILTMFAGNPFDHYFLMIGFAAAIGASIRGNQVIDKVF